MQDDVVVHGERDRVLAGERQLARLAYPMRRARIGRARVDELWPFSLQPQTMALTLPCPCPVAPSDPSSPQWTWATCVSRPAPAGGRAKEHAARMDPTVCGAGRADPDLEHVQGADGHRDSNRRIPRVHAGEEPLCL